MLFAILFQIEWFSYVKVCQKSECWNIIGNNSSVEWNSIYFVKRIHLHWSIVSFLTVHPSFHYYYDHNVSFDSY